MYIYIILLATTDRLIRNYLTVIIAVCEYLSDNEQSIRDSMNSDVTQLDRDKRILSLERNVATLNGACASLAEIVNNEMDLRKLQEGKLELCPTESRFSDLIERIFHILQPKMKELPDVKCVYTVFDKQGWYRFDKHRVQQILTNLISFIYN